MAPTMSPVSVLQVTAEKYPNLPVLKVPLVGPSKTTWGDITYSQFLHDVAAVARYWSTEFARNGWRKGSIVGLWLRGTTYSDIVQIWSVMGAGFIPQLISASITNSTVVYELLGLAGAVALISDSSFRNTCSSGDPPLPTLAAVDVFAVRADGDSLYLHDLQIQPQPDDIVMIAHTSGSVSSLPKLVPLTARWMRCCMAKDAGLPCAMTTQKVSISGGSFCHAGVVLIFLDAMQHGACLVLPTTTPYSSAELREIVQQCGLTRLSIFSSFLTTLLNEAHGDDGLLTMLRGFDVVFHYGQPLESHIAHWARQEGIKLFNAYGSTEVGLMMHATGDLQGDEPILQPPDGTKYEFLPVSRGSGSSQALLELVVLPESKDCPHSSLRDPEDDKFHTGDLFVEVAPGRYLGKGRNDDWIKMHCALRCDTSSIENNAMETCGRDLISAALAIGSGRPSPVLVVERKADDRGTVGSDGKTLEQEIYQRIESFHRRRLSHERIAGPRFILVVDKGTLPRTGAKGNVQRRMAEQHFISQLDVIFS